jgi:periodic tryptophan protein 1
MTSNSPSTHHRLVQGKIFSTTWSPDDPLTLAAAGSHGKLQIWDVGANTSVRKTLGSKLTEGGKALKERTSSGGGIIGVVNDDEGSDDAGDD